MTAVAKFIVKWEGQCPWCGGNILPGEEGSYDFNDFVCHLVCRKLQTL